MINSAAKEHLTSWFSQERNVQRVSFIVSLLLLVLLAKSVAGLVWSFIPAPEPSAAVQPSQSTGTKTQTKQDISISSLHLFGSSSGLNAGDAAQSTTIGAEDAPVTKLELTLLGVLFSEIKEDAHAIIADKQTQIEYHYRIGQEIAPGAELVEIYREKVILRNRGRLETLFLDDQTPEKSANRAPIDSTAVKSANGQPARSIDRTSRADLSKTLGEMRNAMMNDPTSIAEQIQATPVEEDGVFRGFRLAPGKDRSLLARFGLRNGDIVTNVNGVDLDNAMKGMEVFSKVTTATQLQVTVLRRGQLITYTFGVE